MNSFWLKTFLMDNIKRNQAGGISMPEKKDSELTAAGTDIEAVKKANKNSGMSYNEAKEFIARTTGGHGTEIYSDTNFEDVSAQNQQSQKNSE